MDIDWKTLTRVRERHKALAQEELLHQRRAAEAGAARLHEAQAALQAQLDAREQLWQGAAHAAGLSAVELRSANAWSGALRTRIAQAQGGVAAARQQAAAQQARLEDSRRQLRAAAGELEKAERMGQRVHDERRRRREHGIDEAADEVAVQRWRAQRPGRA